MTVKISAYSPTEPVAPVKGSNSSGVVADKPQGEASVAYRQLAASFLLSDTSDPNIKGKRKLFGRKA